MSDVDDEMDHLAIDWLSIQEQQKFFDKFKQLHGPEGTTHHAPVGLNLEQFQKFLTATLYSHLTRTINLNNGSAQQEQVKFSTDQEQKLFRHFDLKQDNLLDRDEFSLLCRNWLHLIYRRKSALVIVDVQNDFIDGSLALVKSPAGQDGAEVVPFINNLLDESLFDTVVYTQDWHPSDHIGFHDNLHLRKYTCKSSVNDQHNADAKGPQDNEKHSSDDSHHGATDASSNHHCKLSKLSSKVKVYDKVLFDEGRMEQILWPRHCVQGSWGAELHPDLKVTQNCVRILKGTQPHVDSYSAFWDNLRLNETQLRDELTSRGITDVFFCGLAYDYCVAASAIDSKRAGFMTYVIEDACRGISDDTIEKMTSDMVGNDILIVSTESTCNYLSAKRWHVQEQHERNGGTSVRPNVRSDDTRKDLLVTSCFKKAFLRTMPHCDV